jgi:hypothetical protein
VRKREREREERRGEEIANSGKWGEKGGVCAVRVMRGHEKLF